MLKRINLEDDPMAPLVMAVNLGSTSYKFKLFDFSDGERELASGHIESIGAAASSWKITAEAYEETGETRCPDHKSAFRFCAEKLNAAGILSSPDKLDGIAFKAVHGGNISGARPVDEQLIKEMEKFSPFAPAHNPMYANLMKNLRKEFPRLKQAAYFETSFHADIPLCRAVYGVPYEWVGQYGIRRYGFHGSSHGYIAGKMREEAPEAQKIISLHLGGSSSICAIENGKSIACSMGATPQSGLFQNNRAGDFDVFCLPRLL
ncbi:MAG: hypothetical protein PHV59_08460, partial [Victivallales bacterium]|nr:hypothetical protein [Victivallales bacterium]